MAAAATYTPDKLELYLERIGFPNATPGSSRLEYVRDSIQKRPLATLTELQRAHLTSIPWGNSGLHYSAHHSISIRPACVFEKLVSRRLDGYCMENTMLFYHVLRSLGYTVYPTGGRVNTAASDASTDSRNWFFVGMGHMVLIVTIDGEKYAVDVGFGSNGPTCPLPLQHGSARVNIAPSEMQLIYDTLPEFVDQTQKVWIYQVRYARDSTWMPMYSFSEVEFLPQDFEVMNFATSQRRTSWFTQTLVCTRMLLDDSGQGVKGLCILAGNTVKVRAAGHSEVVETLKSEEDRVKALAKWFDMHFQEHEIEGIRGLVSQIK
ncbi:arylamine N-acetyltransferase family protein [Aspergillus brunneoviolaceus CBS 621.78]|uniref:N-acetyltransferase family protein n=1 Tax=Aspergillus brunneoviolaceus CBS 621.78 TaxID=1450534 RepID=A0ACD1G219_9EURO|nr:putative N-acetyltransferase family protein [Aspergillus brunneoviolaceus CBS 621.78]RAH43265.1 putative N-acetyltransferase family protein [Aspergillus brunneoviolaceus CBS 621.78]